MAQITLTHAGTGQRLTLEIIRGTLKEQDKADDTAEVFHPYLRKGLGQTGACTVFLPVDEDPQVAEKLLTFAADRGEGKLRISGEPAATCKALLNVTLLGDPPRAELLWNGQKEG